MLVLFLINLILGLNSNPIVLSNPQPTAEVNFSNTEPVSLGIKTSASSVIVVDTKNKQILFGKQEYEKKPIASISKLMAAVVFLEHNPGWDSIVEIQGDDEVGGARLSLSPGESLIVKDLFNASLVASTNNGIMALARSTGLSQDEFVKIMNQKAKELKMRQTNFVEPTGMNPQNVSTAYDLSLLIAEAFKKPEIMEAVKFPAYSFQTQEGRDLRVINTDILLDSFLNSNGYEIVGAKTGFLPESGYCLATQIKKADREIITVVLDSATINDRFLDTKGLAFWAFNKMK